ncbi:MAG: NAD(+)/NADH kinase [Ignavibacteria bacterium]|nr:NAD(+)/NADH kinase [Ignavibacteria bacterium]
MKVAIVGHLGKGELPQAVSAFVQALQREKVEFLVESGVAKLMKEKGRIGSIKESGSTDEILNESDILAAFGGDGTILAAARAAGPRGIPIIGINLGKLGFLAEVAPSEMEEAIADLKAGRYQIEKRSVLLGESDQLRNSPITAVNDIVVAKGRSSRIITLEAHVNDIPAVTYRGDGLIVSTPTGSTAYALSNGGPIVIPGSQVFGLTPISPHSLSGRPLIVPENSILTVTGSDENESVLISADGQEEAVVASLFTLQIRKADYSLNLVRRAKHSYFEVLRAKLLWGRDPRSH